ncbi:MAG: VOC family protein [Deltaproteobacteria bacterium]|nr:VOC family protein [Deltaproteobacteria bacterium]
MQPRFTHVALRVKDLARSVAFYGKYAGLVVCHERVDDGTRVVWLAERAEDPAFVFVLIPMPHTEVERPGVHHFGFTLESRAEVDAVAATARHDRILREGPRDAGPVVGYFCVVGDPDGNWVEFSFGQPINPRELPAQPS